MVASGNVLGVVQVKGWGVSRSFVVWVGFLLYTLMSVNFAGLGRAPQVLSGAQVAPRGPLSQLPMAVCLWFYLLQLHCCVGP